MVEVREIGRKIRNTLPKAERDERLKKMQKEDEKIVNGMFEFLDAQGGWIEFSYRKYPGEVLQIIKLVHGEICDLTMGIVKHLNNTKKKVRRYSMEIPIAGGKPLRTYDTISRLRFTPSSVL
jgi:hypothetical protein